jgi:hypothetical protein
MNGQTDFIVKAESEDFKNTLFLAMELSRATWLVATVAAIRLPSLTRIRRPSPGAVGPASRLRRRYADAPAAAPNQII